MVTYRNAFIGSVLMHCIVLSIFFIHMAAAPPTGNKSLHSVQAYLFAPAQGTEQARSQHHVNLHKAMPPRVQRQSATMAIKPKFVITQNHHVALEARARLTRGERSLLLQALHNAIANTLIYPSQAKFLDQTGATRLSFELGSTGRVDAIRIDRSSGSQLLDEAAIAALHKISPFGLARRYVSAPVHMTITIRFKA